jgi:U3 small nucleolar RNA-associated protein 25
VCPVACTMKISKQTNSEEVSEAESESSEEEEVASEDESSDEDELPAVRPYAALIQSLALESVPRAKRRKLDHNRQEKEANSQDGMPDETVSGVGEAEDADHVEEAEEGPETATYGLLQDDEDLEDASDPFESHFADPENNLLTQRLKSLQQNRWSTKKITLHVEGKAIISVPESGAPDTLNAPTSISSPGELKLKQKLSRVAMKQRPSFNKLETCIAPFIFDYQDILFCDRRPANAESLRRLTCLHAVNHIFKSVSSS